MNESAPYSLDYKNNYENAYTINTKSALADLTDNPIDANCDEIKISVKKINDYLVVSFYDNGSGMKNPAVLLRLSSELKQKKNMIGCKNSGGLLSLLYFKPDELFIITKTKDDTNKKLLMLKSKEYYDKIVDELNKSNDYNSKSLSPLNYIKNETISINKDIDSGKLRKLYDGCDDGIYRRQCTACKQRQSS